MANKLVIEDVSTIDNYTCEVNFRSTFDHLFTGNTFWVSYGCDVSSLPDNILVIPALTTLVPVAWAESADIYVSELDRTFYYTLYALQAAWKEVPTKFGPTGDIYFGNLVENHQPEAGSKSALLFSGGVDSHYSYVEHRQEDPLLVTIHGSDISLDSPEEFNQVKNHVEEFATPRGLDQLSIASNHREILEYPLLDHYYRSNVSRGWWATLQYGLGMIGLCAPLVGTDEIDTVYVSSGHQDFELEPAIHPRLIEQLEWANAHAELVGEGITRQDKLEQISEYIRSDDRPIHIRSCFRHHDAQNCMECEKCSRTALGLLFTGVDPCEHGYPLDATTLEDIRRKLIRGVWTFKSVHVGLWRELKAAADPESEYPINGAQEFVEWLSDADIGSFKSDGRSPRTKRDFIPESLYPIAYRARKRVRDIAAQNS
ncbi:hypothetical protein [Saliphagus sp. LR7]|uniref:hypothetical protein n=1 Tax=Saliphagus sp. LR7 TaxID=2282654 RepID=UPI0013004947|nr:hypothetical protein [Saliphagus sp. LR7]